MATLGLCMDFLQLWWATVLSRCCSKSSHCGGFSCCGTWALGSWVSVVVAHGLSCPEACGIFLDQGLNPVPFIGRQTLNHWTTRQVQPSFSKCTFGDDVLEFLVWGSGGGGMYSQLMKKWSWSGNNLDGRSLYSGCKLIWLKWQNPTLVATRQCEGWQSRDGMAVEKWSHGPGSLYLYVCFPKV